MAQNVKRVNGISLVSRMKKGRMMKTLQTLGFIAASMMVSTTFAADFSFDRPGAGMGTGITPVGHLAWEQGLPSVSYQQDNVAGAKDKT